MGIEIAQNVNSLSSQEQVVKEKVQVQNEEIKKQRGNSAFLSEEDLKIHINALENGIKHFNRRLKFDINKEINRVVVKIIDKDTDKVIREIPSSEIQNLLEKVREAIGLLFDIEI
ncbi:MAG: flagellar protein FlaG [Spirochaetales bacterium]|nr:flagellar protein FlaG [Spirochaetales bacterium]